MIYPSWRDVAEMPEKGASLAGSCSFTATWILRLARLNTGEGAYGPESRLFNRGGFSVGSGETPGWRA
jgi:hypothetical protein